LLYLCLQIKVGQLIFSPFSPFSFCCWIRDPGWTKIRIREKTSRIRSTVPDKKFFTIFPSRLAELRFRKSFISVIKVAGAMSGALTREEPVVAAAAAAGGPPGTAAFQTKVYLLGYLVCSPPSMVQVGPLRGTSAPGCHALV
jgi:hypothetical protein